MSWKTFIRILGVVAVIFLAGVLVTLQPIDRQPYHEKAFYADLLNTLDSLDQLQFQSRWFTKPGDSLTVGWSFRNITPAWIAPLAGYGARKPKEYEAVADSVFVKTLVIRSGTAKVALIIADLLIIHPELTWRVYDNLPSGWMPSELYFTATHTHSSLGGWAPGIVGELFSGPYDEQAVGFLANKIVESVAEASEKPYRASLSTLDLNIPSRVKNRFVGDEGGIDPWFKTIRFTTEKGQVYLSTYSAHATCLGLNSRYLSGDYPGIFNHYMEKDSGVVFSAFAAGAVGSMGPVTHDYEEDTMEAKEIAKDLHTFLSRQHGAFVKNAEPLAPVSFHLPIPLREPTLKVSTRFGTRPWLFRYLMGDYPAHISVLMIGRNLFVGLPCDFSGELAIPLYQKAEESGIRLTITSFNGAYIGYVVKDDWFDKDEYESKTMSWYGPDAGAYFSEIIERIIQSADKHLSVDDED